MNTGSSNVKQVTADPSPPKSKPCGTSSVRLVNSSAHSRNTLTSAEAEYLHPFIAAETAEASSDNLSNADTEDSDIPEIGGVCSYVTSGYAGFLQSRENAVEKASSHHQRWVKEYYCRAEDWWQMYDQGLFDGKRCQNGAPGSFKNVVR